MSTGFRRQQHEDRTRAAVRRWLRQQQGAWAAAVQAARFKPSRISRGFLQEQREEIAGLLVQQMLPSARDSLRLEVQALPALDDAARAALVASAAAMLADALRLAAGRAAREIVAGTVAGLSGYGANLADLLGQRLTTLFSLQRAEGIAITQTTVSRSAAQTAVGDALMIDGDAVDYEWATEQDQRVCEICRGLNGALKAVWGGRFPGGPPAHPRCRCDLVLRYQPGDRGAVPKFGRKTLAAGR